MVVAPDRAHVAGDRPPARFGCSIIQQQAERGTPGILHRADIGWKRRRSARITATSCEYRRRLFETSTPSPTVRLRLRSSTGLFRSGAGAVVGVARERVVMPWTQRCSVERESYSSLISRAGLPFS